MAAKDFAGMTKKQVVGTSGFLNALLVKEGVRPVFKFQPPEYSDSYGSTKRGKRSIQYRAKTLKRYVPGLIQTDEKDGLLFSKIRNPDISGLNYPCVENNRIKKHTRMGIYVFLEDRAILPLFHIDCKNNRKNVMFKILQEFAKKANIVFKKHRAMLEKLDIFVKETIAIKIVKLKGDQ